MLTAPIVAILAVVAFGWLAEAIIAPTLPALVLDRGGDAFSVGLVTAAYAIPSLLLRPLIGRQLDRSGSRSIHRAGASLLALAPLVYLLPGILIVAIGRVVHGFGWAMFASSNNALVARHAPVHRRAEASGYFNVMWAVAFLIGPPLGITLYRGIGDAAPFIVAALSAGTALLLIGLVPPLVAARDRDHGFSRPADGPATRRPGRYLEPSVMPMMVTTMLVMSGQTLFIAFAPVYARSIGAPLEDLRPFYPVLGLLHVAVLLAFGRLSDRIGRRRTVTYAIALGVIGLVIAALPFGLLTFTIGGACYAAASALATPATTAAAMDAAPPTRLGGAMASFSIGYQLASGLGGFAWGIAIAAFGYPTPFLIAIGLLVMCAAIVARTLPGRPDDDVGSSTIGDGDQRFVQTDASEGGQRDWIDDGDRGPAGGRTRSDHRREADGG